MFCTIVSNLKCSSVQLVILFALPLFSQADERLGFNWRLETQIRRDDNVYRTIDQLSVSDTILLVNPELAWLSKYGKHIFDVSYQGDYGHYFDENELDYDDHELTAHALLDHSYRLDTLFTLGYDWNHDHPGETEVVFIPNEAPSKWQDGYVKAQVFFGRIDSQGQITGELAYHKRRYGNNDQEFRDHTHLNTRATFYYRVAPKTRLLFEARLTDFDYQTDDIFGSNQANKEYHYLTGMTWEATAKTTGTFKIGYRDKNYDAEQFGEMSGLAIRLDAEWRPNTYTLFTLKAAQETQESAQQGRNAFVRQYVNAGMEHSITSLTRLFAKAHFGHDQFDDNFNREDDRWSLLLGVKHNLLPWLDLAAEYRHENRDSNLDSYNYSANALMLVASAKFAN